MKKIHVYVNNAPDGEMPNIVELWEYERDVIPYPGALLAIDTSTGPLTVMAFEVSQKPGTDEFVILAGRPF